MWMKRLSLESEKSWKLDDEKSLKELKKTDLKNNFI